MTSPRGALPEPTRSLDTLDGIPRDWYAGNAALTHIANRVFAVVAEMELLISGVTRQALDAGRVNDPQVEAAARAFIGEDAVLTSYHNKVYEMLFRRGYEVDSLLHRIRAEIHAFEAERDLNQMLSVVAGLEHVAASVGAWYLRSGESLGLPEPVHEVLDWRLTEGLVHHGVVFQVYRDVCRPSGLHRLRGLVASGWLVNHLQHVVLDHLGAQEVLPTAPGLFRAERRRFFAQNRSLTRALVGAHLRYARPGFKPSALGYRALALEMRGDESP